MGFSLKNLLMEVTGHHNNVQPAAPAPQPHTDLPSNAAFNNAMLNQNMNDLPQDNLDGTFSNLQPNHGAVFQRAGGWHPPLAIGQTDGAGIPYFDPLASKERYTDSSYYAVPINPNAVPPLKSYLQPIRGNQ